MRESGIFLRVTLLAAGLLGAINAHSASFDCAKAASHVEKLICGTPHLSKLDEDLGALYSSALKDQARAAQIRAAQREWVKARDQCVDEACLRVSYQVRVCELMTCPAAAAAPAPAPAAAIPPSPAKPAPAPSAQATFAAPPANLPQPVVVPPPTYSGAPPPTPPPPGAAVPRKPATVRIVTKRGEPTVPNEALDLVWADLPKRSKLCEGYITVGKVKTGTSRNNATEYTQLYEAVIYATEVRKLTKADEINGLEWSGTIEIASQVTREFDRSGNWAEWWESKGPLQVVLVYWVEKRNGKWIDLPLTEPAAAEREPGRTEMTRCPR